MQSSGDEDDPFLEGHLNPGICAANLHDEAHIFPEEPPAHPLSELKRQILQWRQGDAKRKIGDESGDIIVRRVDISLDEEGSSHKIIHLSCNLHLGCPLQFHILNKSPLLLFAPDRQFNKRMCEYVPAFNAKAVDFCMTQVRSVKDLLFWVLEFARARAPKCRFAAHKRTDMKSTALVLLKLSQTALECDFLAVVETLGSVAFADCVPGLSHRVFGDFYGRGEGFLSYVDIKQFVLTAVLLRRQLGEDRPFRFIQDQQRRGELRSKGVATLHDSIILKLVSCVPAWVRGEETPKRILGQWPAKTKKNLDCKRCRKRSPGIFCESHSL